MLKRVSAAILFLSVALMAFGQAKTAGQQSAFQKLQAEFNAAMQEYYKPYQNVHSQEEAAKIKLDPSKNPFPLYLPKFQAVAKKLGKSSEGFQAWMMVNQLAEQSKNAAASDEATAALLTNFASSPLLAQFVSTLPYSYYDMPKERRMAKINALLDTVDQKATLVDVKAAALYARGQLVAQDNPSKAADLYRELVAKYPESSQGKRAKGDIFEMENLVPGKLAPDFDAVDQDGTMFKLSDYRGKVVVLDFWGFW